MNKRLIRFAISTAAVLVLAAGCSSSGSPARMPGPEMAPSSLLASWRQHIGFFVNYTLGKATQNDKQVAKAKADLDAYRTSFGELINSVIPELPAGAVAEELIPHVDTLFAAIDASVAGGPDDQTKLSKAADHMPMTAAILTSGIVANKKIDS